MKLFFNIPINFTQLFFFTLLCPLFAVCALKSRVSAFEEIIFDPCAGFVVIFILILQIMESSCRLPS